MRKLLAIVSGDPNSINSEIIAKTWKRKKIFKGLNFFIIGNFILLKKQFKKLDIKIKVEKIDQITNRNFKKKLYIYDVPLKFKNPFKVSNHNKQNYIHKSLKIAFQLISQNKITGLINCAMDKKDIANRKNVYGVTELLASKSNVLGKEVMLIYNNSLSVSPITTHIRLRDVTKNISTKKIIGKVITISNFFKTKLGKKVKIGVLGLNPHNDEFRKNSEENKIIKPAILYLKKKRINIEGPISADTAFIDYKKRGYDVLIGMYHDQVLTPFKSIFNFNAINITLGLPFIRVSPDHGTGRDIVMKNKGNPRSLIESINFFKKINVKT